MIDFERELWQQTPVNETLLTLYLEHDRLLKEKNPEYDGWFGRLDDHPDIPSEELTAAHGNLIALGYLKVDIGGRTNGVKYQITPAGKRQLDTEFAIAGFGDSDESETCTAADEDE
ncbi:MAG: hypothetical protein O2955_10455 [Planctomycetota bacterium]|nr:hypothetical protein [Planctomycetota bacterium]MDA1212932.1 hypothetical protein [Planctomycetota bacterium]